jgi:IclR family transcriptional regulator, pca regulon regulatory protein
VGLHDRESVRRYELRVRLSRRRPDYSNIDVKAPSISAMLERSATGSAHSQSLERGLSILSAFRSGRPLLGVSEIGREIGLGRSTTHRYVATLATLGYLQQDIATKKYRLGPRVLDLGFSAINSMELRELAAPHLRRLSDETGYTVNMAILDGLDIVYVERCRSTQAGQREIDLNLHVGARLPAYCTSLGKVLLAWLPPQEQSAALDEVDFSRRGPNTITSRSALTAELARVRVAGFAINNEELAYGLRSIAAPILDHQDAAAAAINLAVHSSMVSIDDLSARLSETVRRAAADISAHLGYRPA